MKPTFGVFNACFDSCDFNVMELNLMDAFSLMIWKYLFFSVKMVSKAIALTANNINIIINSLILRKVLVIFIF